jgi:hypothetical protein
MIWAPDSGERRLATLSSPLKNPIYCDRLQSPLASFSSLDDLNVIGAAPMTCRGRVASALWPDARIDDEVVSKDTSRRRDAADGHKPPQPEGLDR